MSDLISRDGVVVDEKLFENSNFNVEAMLGRKSSFSDERQAMIDKLKEVDFVHPRIGELFASTIKESYQGLKMRGDNLPHDRIIQDLADRYSISASEIEEIVLEAPKEETL